MDTIKLSAKELKDILILYKADALLTFSEEFLLKYFKDNYENEYDEKILIDLIKELEC